MLRTYKAILNDDKLKWLEEKPDCSTKDKDAFVIVTILDREIPGEIDKSNANTLVEFFKNSPLYGSQIDLERDEDWGREVHQDVWY
jgi:hypothetical protein